MNGHIKRVLVTSCLTAFAVLQHDRESDGASPVEVPIELDATMVGNLGFHLPIPNAAQLFPLDGSSVDYVFRFADGNFIQVSDAPGVVWDVDMATTGRFEYSGTRLFAETALTDENNDDIVAHQAGWFYQEYFRDDPESTTSLNLFGGALPLDLPGFSMYGFRITATMPAVSDASIVGAQMFFDATGGQLDVRTWVAEPMLQPGDANQDLVFDERDVAQVLQAGKYLTGARATWGDGDWNGGPGGYLGEPPDGDGRFDQQDIVAALQTGHYLNGSYAALQQGGAQGDEQTSIVYDAETGEIGVDTPHGWDSILIESAAGIFVHPENIAYMEAFDFIDETEIFRACFGSMCGSMSLGFVAQPRLSEDFVASDLTVTGTISGGRGFGAVDLIFVPEPAAALMGLIGLAVLLHWRRR